MLPTRAMIRTTVKTKNIAACSSEAPHDRVGSRIVRQRECNTRFWTNISGRCGRGAPAISGSGDVLGLGLIENSCDCRLGPSVIYFLAGGHPSIAPVAFEHERQRTKAVWKFILRRICGAGGFVDEDRSRGRVCIEPVEWIVGEQESILFGDFECSQALTAWAGAACNFDVSRMTVLRGFASAARGD